MKLLTLIAAIVVTLSLLLAPCASDQVNAQKPVEQVHHAKFALPSLPRKLKVNEEATVKSPPAHKDSRPPQKFMEPSSGTKQHGKEENVVHAAGKGTWRQWVEEGPKRSEYFTMDYGWVRSRSPIHNKQIPFVP